MRCPLYRNGFSLWYFDTCAYIWLAENEIHVVLQGKNTSELLEALQELMRATKVNYPGISLSHCFFCPKCLCERIQQRFETENSPLFTGIPDGNIVTFASDELNSRGKSVRCINGHIVDIVAFNRGYLFSPAANTKLNVVYFKRTQTIEPESA